MKGEVNERLLSILEAQVERSAPKENPNYKANSIFLQENGEPWAKQLRCEFYFGSINYNDTPLTKAEVDALNTVQPLEKATITKNDGSPLIVSVLPKADALGTLSRLTITPYVAPGQKVTDAKFEKNLNLTMPSIISIATQLAAQATVAA